jgi:hypothetical protein
VVGAKLDCSEADDRNPEMFGKNRVEFGDSAGPGVEMIAGYTVNHSVEVDGPREMVEGP